MNVIMFIISTYLKYIRTLILTKQLKLAQNNTLYYLFKESCFP